MIILADEHIPYVTEAFSTIGTVQLLPGRHITRAALGDAEVVLVRSITPVNRSLLEGSRVRFVGTATAGVDHVDRAYLKAHNIGFASAAGANANSVAEYVIAALLVLARRHGFTLAGKTIGIIGVGHIGTLVRNKVQALGMIPVLNDPPLAQRTGDPCYQSLEDALACDIVTIHVPLTTEGPFRTFHLLDARTLARISSSTILLNTSRGEVVDNECLAQRLFTHAVGPTILDVWEHEPHLRWDLLQEVSLGTPHIAGYSLDGKAHGTKMIYDAVCRHFGLIPSWSPSTALPPPRTPVLEIDATSVSEEEALSILATQVYNPEHDDARMRTLLKLPFHQRASAFDELRHTYPVRREFHCTTVRLRHGTSSLIEKIRGIGFQIEAEHPDPVPRRDRGSR